jgi:hypothetical protein
MDADQSVGRWPVSMPCLSCGCETWFRVLIGLEVKNFEYKSSEKYLDVNE